MAVGAVARERGGPALGGESERALDGVPAGEREREPGGEAVAGAVGVRRRPGRRRRAVGARTTVGGLPRSAAVTRSCNGQLRLGLQVAPRVAFARIVRAADERVELDSRLLQNGQGAGGRHENARLPRRARGGGVAADEVDAVECPQFAPGQGIASAWDVLLADDRDRPLAVGVDEREAATLRPGMAGGLDADAEPCQLVERRLPELVAAERRVERAGAGEPR